MKTLYPECPFGDLSEDTKFNELSEYTQSHFQNKNEVNAMDEGNNPMHAWEW